MRVPLDPREMTEVFGENDPNQYAAEAEQRWGTDDKYHQTKQRVARYTKDDWVRIRAEEEANVQRFRELFVAGTPADSPEAMNAAEEHRLHIARYFYGLDHEFHRGKGDMYVADERFAKRYESVAAGLTAYLRDAIHANADRAANR